MEIAFLIIGIVGIIIGLFGATPGIRIVASGIGPLIPALSGAINRLAPRLIAPAFVLAVAGFGLAVYAVIALATGNGENGSLIVEPTSTPPPSPISAAPTLTSTPTATPLPPTLTPTPPVKFNFEDGRMGWRCQKVDDTQACMELLISSELAHDGRNSLQMNVDLIGGHLTDSNSEAWVDLRQLAPAGVTLPLDLTDQTVTAWVFAPAGSEGEIRRPNGFQIFVKDEDFNSQYGNWCNALEDQWVQLSLTVRATEPRGGCLPDAGFTDVAFDPTRIIAVGVKLGAGGGSTDTYQGPIYIDEVNW